MAKGTNGATLVSKQRLQLFKELQDIENGTNYLGLHSTADTATVLATSRTINGMSFNGSSSVSNYVVCSTAAATAAKEVTKTGFVLESGARLTVKFTYGNSAATNPTLQVNSESAVAIKFKGQNVPEGLIEAEGIYEFVYDGTYFSMISASGSGAGQGGNIFTPATAQDDGDAGLVPGPTAGNNTGKYLDASGNWSIPQDTTYTEFTASTAVSAGEAGLVPAPAAGDGATKFLNATGSWSVPYSAFTGSTTSAAGTAGLVPAPSAALETKYLSNRGTWDTMQDLGNIRYYHETDTTYNKGEIVHVEGFPMNYVLEATTNGTTAVTRPDFSTLVNNS